MELPSYFQTFLSNIEPTSNQENEASMGHTTLRWRLEKDEKYKDYFLDSFLSGSYGRNTVIRPIKDVDIIIITSYSEILWKPELTLYHLKGILSNYYNNVTLQSRSVNVALSYVDMDIVPAINTNGTFLKIPDRTAQNWVISNPRKHLELSIRMNDARNGLYKPLVKALKRWRDNRMNDSWKPKSFVLECMIYDYANNTPITSIPNGLNGFFAFTHKKYETYRKVAVSPTIDDPAGTGNNIAKNWANQDFIYFYDEVWKSWNLCYDALTSQDKTVSIEKWRQLLGDSFPVNI
jgi:hypothetical protein